MVCAVAVGWKQELAFHTRNIFSMAERYVGRAKVRATEARG